MQKLTDVLLLLLLLLLLYGFVNVRSS